MADGGAFEPIWSAEIHAEWTTNLATSKLKIPPDKIAYRVSQMQKAFPAADCDADPLIVLEVQALCRTPRQRKDAHVVATSIRAKAAIIVTDNMRDFAPAVLDAYGLMKMRPETFCLHLLEASPGETLLGLRHHRASMKRKFLDPDSYLAYLEDDLRLQRLPKALQKCLGNF